MIASILLECDYSPPLKQICQIVHKDLILKRSDRVIGEVSEISKNSTVTAGFSFRNSKVFYFPLGLEIFFEAEKIIAIQVYYSRMKEIRKTDLKPFMNLKDLDLTGNHLEVLEKDLFIYNKNLNNIYLNDNKISHIDSKVFDDILLFVGRIILHNNICKFSAPDQEFKKDIAKVQSGSCNDVMALLKFESVSIMDYLSEDDYNPLLCAVTIILCVISIILAIIILCGKSRKSKKKTAENQIESQMEENLNEDRMANMKLWLKIQDSEGEIEIPVILPDLNDVQHFREAFNY